MAGLDKYVAIGQDSAEIDAIINKHAPMVKRIAHHLLGRLPASVQLDDLVQAGMIGLLEASKNYDASKGASFETYAGIRIRGMMLDEVRKGDWVPRSVHRNARMISEKVKEIENKHGRDAKAQEIADALNISVGEYHQMLLDSTGCRLFGLDELVGGHESIAAGDGLSSALPDPFEDVHQDSIKQELAKIISSIPERERLVLALYYDEELNLKEIGEVLGVSESRVCQIHSQAMVRLQARIDREGTP